MKDLLQKRVLQREVESRLFVPEKLIRETCAEELQARREIDVGHILVTGGGKEATEKLEMIQTQIKAGVPFEELAVKFSEDPSAARNKGRLGIVARGQFVKEFEDAAFAMTPGEVSPPVKTKFGHHIIKLFAELSKEKLDCEKIPEAVRRRLHTKAWTRLRSVELKKYLAKLRKHAEIIVFD